MVFSSALFVYVYLPVALGIYYAVPRKFKNGALLALNLLFYGWGEPFYVVLLVLSTVCDYTCGKKIEENRGNQIIMKRYLLISVLFNLGLLGWFKYYDFLASQINRLVPVLPVFHITLPLGISFYTFQTMSYTIDVYRNETPVQNSIVNFGMYVSLFPQLIAGPIVRYADIEKDIDTRKHGFDEFGKGVRRFLLGLSKKLILANAMGALHTEILIYVTEITVVGSWLAVVAFAFQIYFDFSGYSDMAIGLGYMFGFSFPENFNYPYLAKTATEFWRRWHMTLGTWFKEYVYFPLGGSRVSTVKHIRNICIVWLLTGIWHGASYNYIAWGVYYGLVLLAEKFILADYMKKLPSIVQHMYGLFVIAIGWLIFSCEDFTVMGQLAKAMFGGALWIDSRTLYWLSTYGVQLILCAVCSLPVITMLKNRIHAGVYDMLTVIAVVIAILVNTAYLVDAGFNPFLYFRF
ncbi:MAG: MBOAT family protein [Erysipelotrichaceae bacterium]|nr:MBOAT family protein [Erysipelotrichaceae bacterium]